MNTVVIETKNRKIRTTLYLTQENKERLDRIPRGKKTELMNSAIANALENLEREENKRKFIKMITQIKPVKAELSSENMVKLLREGQEQQLLDNKKTNAK